MGAAFENDMALKPALDQIKPIVERAPGLESNDLLGLHECSEDGNTLWQIAHDVIPIAWSRVYAPLIEARQSLASILSTQKAATSRFQIAANADAVSLCCLTIEAHCPRGRRGIDSWADKPWYEEDPRVHMKNKNPLMGRE